MMGRTHIIVGTGISLSLLHLGGVSLTVPAVAVALVSSVLPDIDEPNSLLVTRVLPNWLLRLVQIALIIAAAIGAFYGMERYPWNLILAVLIAIVSFMPSRSLRQWVMFFIGLGLIVYGGSFHPWNLLVGSLLILTTLVPHRGLTHTLYGVGVWTFLLYGTTQAYGDSVWMAGGLSYLLHLIADSLTNRGIKPLPPLKWKIKFKLMSTGTKQGAWVEIFFIGVTFIIAWIAFSPLFL
ncbi:metal-dependent hydrolase [Neobacillus mesonae]|nr:metal-dependent hydrolase [Neobacillus mesonae]